ncbi:MAG: ABC transporter transmembrane domain-containing protein, partial [Aeromicrobium sp.]
MSMDATAWSALHRTMNTYDGSKKVTRETLRRIATFAVPHKRMLIMFLIMSVITAALAVATPVLAGHVVNAIVNGDAKSTVFKLAGLIALIALADAGFGIFTRWLSSNIGEGLILDLRTKVFDHVQRMPV